MEKKMKNYASGSRVWVQGARKRGGGALPWPRLMAYFPLATGAPGRPHGFRLCGNSLLFYTRWAFIWAFPVDSRTLALAKQGSLIILPPSPLSTTLSYIDVLRVQ